MNCELVVCLSVIVFFAGGIFIMCWASDAVDMDDSEIDSKD